MKIPDGMIEAFNAVGKCCICVDDRLKQLEAALAWLAEHPIAPTMEQAHEIFMLKAGFDFDLHEWVRWGACEWQRRMFRELEPEIHEAVKDLLYSQHGRVGCNDPIEASRFIAESDRRVLEAYRRGLTARDARCQEGSTSTSTPAPATLSAAWADSRKRR